MRLRVTFERLCPRCGSRGVSKSPRRFRYSCSRCDLHFTGIRLFILRLAFGLDRRRRDRTTIAVDRRLQPR